MKLVYLASASKGNRFLLKQMSDFLSQDCVVFAPCLGFFGNEDSFIRDRIMNFCFHIVKGSDAFVALWEGVDTDGVWQELKLADNAGIPICILRMSEVKLPVMHRFFNDPHDVKEWLNELQTNTRDFKG